MLTRMAIVRTPRETRSAFCGCHSSSSRTCHAPVVPTKSASVWANLCCGQRTAVSLLKLVGLGESLLWTGDSGLFTQACRSVGKPNIPHRFTRKKTNNNPHTPPHPHQIHNNFNSVVRSCSGKSPCFRVSLLPELDSRSE